MVAKRRHPRFPDRCTAIFNETEKILIVPRADLREVTGPHEDERRMPRAASIGSVALGAVREVQALYRRRRLWYRVREKQDCEDGADQYRQRGSDDDQ